jgi:glutaconate CoA-transferase subunit A
MGSRSSLRPVSPEGRLATGGVRTGLFGFRQALILQTLAASTETCSSPLMRDKRIRAADVVAQLADGMTIGIGGWGSRRKPMSIVREIVRSSLRDLTIVSYGGPDVGLLCATGKVKKLVYGFVSLDSIPLEPHFRAARQAGAVQVMELDEGMLQWGLYAASLRLPFLPTRAGLGSDVLAANPEIRLVQSPYADGEQLVAVPAITLDAAIVHMNRADMAGNAQFLGPDPYFDDLFLGAAQERRFLSCEKIVPTAELSATAALPTLRVNRMMVDGVISAPNGAHFTSCEPDYGRDEAFQKEYAASAASADAWLAFRDKYLAGDEASYQARVAEAVRK